MSNKLRHRKTDFLFTGFALFAMFFGAGNLIFPPELGLLSGDEWPIGFIGFFIADAGLATFGMFSMMKNNGDILQLTAPLGKIMSKVLAIVVVLCIGPCIAIPRTGLVTYSLGVVPVMGIDESDNIALGVFSIIFFAIVFVLSIKRSRVVDIVGKILTPLLLISLFVLLIVGITHSNANVGKAITDNCVREGVVNGYQTMDALASLIFAGIIISSLQVRGYETDKREGRMQLGKSSLVACGLLFLVYGGLTFLGAAFGGPWTQDVISGKIDQAALLTNIVHTLLGRAGVVIIAVIVLFACLTTAIGLTSSLSTFFVNLTKEKISYKGFVILICVCGMLLCNVGLAEIISLAVPILLFVFPLVIVLMTLGIFRGRFTTSYPHVLGGVVALVISGCSILNDTFQAEWFDWTNRMPLSEYGLNWVIPAVVAVLIGIIIEKIKRVNKKTRCVE